MCCHIDFGNRAMRPSCVTTGLRPSNHPTSTACLGPCHWDGSLNRCPDLSPWPSPPALPGKGVPKLAERCNFSTVSAPSPNWDMPKTPQQGGVVAPLSASPE